MTSFTATPGRIEAHGGVKVTDPITWIDNAVYGFQFVSNSKVPANGYFEIEMPNDVSVDFDIALRYGSCESLKCFKMDDRRI